MSKPQAFSSDGKPASALQSSVTPRVTVVAASPGQASAVSVTPRVNMGPAATANKTPSTAPRTIVQPAYHGGAGGAQYVVTIQDPAVEGHMQEVMTDASGQTLIYHGAHGQYVGGVAEPLLYSQEMYDQWEKYGDYDGSGMYSTYYQASQVGGMLGQMDGIPGHMQGGAYVLQGNMMDGEGGQLVAHTTRASPATVQWLIDNYEVAEGVSLPRNTLYNHYLRHCHELKMDPMNPASFGKLIRSVFLGLRTRRLGTRGNSKYHYYGIRIKQQSLLNQFPEEGSITMRQQSSGGLQRRFKTALSADSPEGLGQTAPQEPMTPAPAQHVHQQFLGDATAAVPHFAVIDIGNEALAEGVTLDDLQLFGHLYREHCKAIVECVVNLKFSQIEHLWRVFWHGGDLSQDSLASEEDLEKTMPQESLFAMCSMSAFQKYICRSDQAFYQALVEVLIPDVLRPIPSSLTQAIRNFGKNLDTWLKNATLGVPEDLVKAKMTAVMAFAQTLRRYTSLNHLAQAARAVLQNSSQISQMVADLNKVDFSNIQDQASWVCECDDTMVRQLEQDFKRSLQQQLTLEQWAVWLDSFVNRLLKPFTNSPHYAKMARQVLLKWSFYSSLVIRDLTLRSAASFGSFHLIRLLYDEYIFYLVEHKVANALNESPLSVLNELRLVKDEDNCLSPSSMLADLNDVPKVTSNKNVATPVQPSSGVAVGRVISVTMPPGTGVSGAAGTRTGPLAAKHGQTIPAGSTATNKTIAVMPISHGTANTSAIVDGQPVSKKTKMG